MSQPGWWKAEGHVTAETMAGQVNSEAPITEVEQIFSAI